MTAKDHLKKIALASSIYYTAATFLLLFLFFVLNVDNSTGIQPVKLIAVLPFAIFFAAANDLYRSAKWARWLRVLCHYVLTVGGAFLFLYLPNKDPSQKASGALLLFVVFTVVYFLIMGTVLIVTSRIQRVKRDTKGYQSVYRKK